LTDRPALFGRLSGQGRLARWLIADRRTGPPAARLAGISARTPFGESIIRG